MKKGLSLRVFIGSLLFLIGSGLTVIPGASGAPVAFENLTQDIGRGFGDNWNRYAWSMQEFNGDVYVGTWSAQLGYTAIPNANTLRTLMGGDLEGIDLSYLMACLSSIPAGNWIGTEVWASRPGSAPVPEPATLLLLGSGLLALAGFGRRQTR